MFILELRAHDPFVGSNSPQTHAENAFQNLIKDFFFDAYNLHLSFLGWGTFNVEQVYSF